MDDDAGCHAPLPRSRAARSLSLVGIAAALAFVLGACSAAPREQLHVSAAASVAEVAEEVAALLEEQTDVDVRVNTGGSSTLVEQLLRGAPVDVLLTADERTMQRAVDAGAVATPVPFARNAMVVAWPAAGPARTIDDLAEEDLLVGLCAPSVPCGATARDALTALGLTPAPDTEDADVRTLLTRLAAGELDVGVVYATDLAAVAGDVAGTDLPGATTTLVATTTPQGGDRAAAFVDLLRSPAGAAILRDHGFEVVEEGP